MERLIVKRLTDGMADIRACEGIHCGCICEEYNGLCCDCPIQEATEKLKTYEDAEEQLESVYGECDGLLKKIVQHFVKHGAELEEPSYKALLLTDEEVDEWNEYKQLKEQGLLLRLKCKVEATVYCIFTRRTECTEHNQTFEEYSCQGCECLECDSKEEKYVSEEIAYSLDWIVTNLERFGKTIFLTKEEAEQALQALKEGVSNE